MEVPPGGAQDPLPAAARGASRGGQLPPGEGPGAPGRSRVETWRPRPVRGPSEARPGGPGRGGPGSPACGRCSGRSRARSGARVGALLAAPVVVRLVVFAVALVIVWSAANWTYQVIRKPSELFFPVSGTLTKAPAETWRSYAPLFRRHATATITPELLAALAQVEGAGDPVARTYWRWQVAWHPFEVYRPASSAVGMYQITDPTFREAKRFCVRDHVVAEDACWFRGLYTRVLPSHAVELTSALLDRMVARTLERRRIVHRDAPTEAGPRGPHPSLRRGRGRRPRAARVPARAGTAVRRPRHRPLTSRTSTA